MLFTDVADGNYCGSLGLKEYSLKAGGGFAANLAGFVIDPLA
jgi:hypothetical protein